MHPLTQKIKDRFWQHRNEAMAPGMRAYMKNLFPFLGIKSPQRREIIRQLSREEKIASFCELKTIAEELWSLDEREYQYAAMDLVLMNKKLWTAELPALAESLIIRKSWWDTVDCLASSIFGAYVLKFKFLPEPLPDRWLTSSNMWLNRSAIIFQLSHKEKTDISFLEKAIARHVGSDEFFIRKAIGWALRQYARSNPSFVKEMAAGYPLKPLSRREAMKHLE